MPRPEEAFMIYQLTAQQTKNIPAAVPQILARVRAHFELDEDLQSVEVVRDDKGIFTPVMIIHRTVWDAFAPARVSSP